MTSTYIPNQLRDRVAEQARHRCGYCLTSEDVVGFAMEMDHLIPQVLGGLTVEENLWLACPACNGFKGHRISARDPETVSLSGCSILVNRSGKSTSSGWSRAVESSAGRPSVGRPSRRFASIGRSWSRPGGAGSGLAGIHRMIEGQSPRRSQ